MPEITYLEAINQALHEEMARDPNVFMAGIDIAERGDVFGATQGLYSKYGEARIMDTPIPGSGLRGPPPAPPTAGAAPRPPAQPSQSLEVLLCRIPGLKVVAPSTPYDAKGLMK